MSLQNSIDYLNSSAALQSLNGDPYWPKWNSPWWHMLILHELGSTDKIPEKAIARLVECLNDGDKTFPIDGHKVQKSYGKDRTSCHCALGNIYQVLAKWGVDVDGELPWIRPWFLRHQVSDGGLNCSSSAYQENPVPSSMVGTIAPLEAVLLYTTRPFTSAEEKFLDLGADCLIKRKLMFSTTNPRNAEEKEDEEDWLRLCFPRFYLYDVLRGLTFILNWAKRREKPLPKDALSGVVGLLSKKFPDGKVRIGRKSYEGISTRFLSGKGVWERGGVASLFPLLEDVSQVGALSPALSAEWELARKLSAEHSVI